MSSDRDDFPKEAYVTWTCEKCGHTVRDVAYVLGSYFPCRKCDGTATIDQEPESDQS